MLAHSNTHTHIQTQRNEAVSSKEAAEARYAQLRERHTAARVEFDKLKALATERKRAAIELQQQVCVSVCVFCLNVACLARVNKTQ